MDTKSEEDLVPLQEPHINDQPIDQPQAPKKKRRRKRKKKKKAKPVDPEVLAQQKKEEEMMELRQKLRTRISGSQNRRSGQLRRESQKEAEKVMSKKKRKQLGKMLNNDGLHYILKQFGIQDPQVERDIMKDLQDSDVTKLSQMSDVIGKHVNKHQGKPTQPGMAELSKMMDSFGLGDLQNLGKKVEGITEEDVKMRRVDERLAEMKAEEENKDTSQAQSPQPSSQPQSVQPQSVQPPQPPPVLSAEDSPTQSVQPKRRMLKRPTLGEEDMDKETQERKEAKET